MEAEIVALQLPLVVQHALLAMGSSLAVACVDGPLPAGKIAGVLIAAGAITILAANWDVMAPKWGHITRAFQKAFDATAASIVQALNDIKIKASKKSAEEKAKSSDKEYKTKKEVKGKQKDDIPERFKGEKPYKGESGKDAAMRVLKKHGEYNPKDTGPTSNFNRLKKYFDTHFE